MIASVLQDSTECISHELLYFVARSRTWSVAVQTRLRVSGEAVSHVDPSSRARMTTLSCVYRKLDHCHSRRHRASHECTQSSSFSTSLVAVNLSTTASCTQLILYWLETRVGVRIRRRGGRFLLRFSVQREVAEAIFQSLGTSPSERGRGAVLTMSLDSGVATGVAASSSCTSEGGRVRQDGEVSPA